MNNLDFEEKYQNMKLCIDGQEIPCTINYEAKVTMEPTKGVIHIPKGTIIYHDNSDFDFKLKAKEDLYINFNYDEKIKSYRINYYYFSTHADTLYNIVKIFFSHILNEWLFYKKTKRIMIGEIDVTPKFQIEYKEMLQKYFEEIEDE